MKKRFSIGTKMYLFVIVTILMSAIALCTMSYMISVNQIDTYYKRITINNALNAVTLMDAGYLKRLRTVAESEEFQSLRDRAEEEDDESKVIEYLKGQGLWEQYVTEREKLRTYVANMKDIKYLYVIAWGDIGADHDMYVLDSDSVKVYETGYYELREPEFENTDPNNIIDPVISNGDWGWLCSGYAPVRDENGNVVCHVGCDVDMEDVIHERWVNVTYMAIGAFLITAIVLAGSFVFINRTVISPLKDLTTELKNFSPKADQDYEASGVVDLNIHSHDEIEDIYKAIQTMQIRIIDSVNDINVIRSDKQRVERDMREKEREIGEISREAYRDSLTGVGNKTAYTRKIKEFDGRIKNGFKDLAIIMMDVNRLKIINDNYGHSYGDIYLKGCCHIFCDILKRSPIYRIGGDEFVAILTGEDYINRKEKLEELKRAFDASFRNNYSDPWMRFSAAVGISDYSPEDGTVEPVFERADRFMYEAKQQFKEENKTE